jgi:hypothetical protein
VQSKQFRKPFSPYCHRMVGALTASLSLSLSLSFSVFNSMFPLPHIRFLSITPTRHTFLFILLLFVQANHHYHRHLLS